MLLTSYAQNWITKCLPVEMKLYQCKMDHCILEKTHLELD